MLDSKDLEQERGITILSKATRISWGGHLFNIVDTPGHADFGGEVERILNMADACLLLVDAQEGPMPQTKFVLKQALKLGRKVIVCINKVDKPAARCDWVLDTTFDLFADLGADDELCDFPVSYASGFLGVASLDGPDSLEKDLSPILDQILEECPKPRVDTQAPLQMLVSNLDFDPYIGRISIGRVRSGSLKVGQELGFKFGPEGDLRKAKVVKLWDFHNNERRVVDEVKAGDICAFCGMDDVAIGDTVVDPENPKALPPIIVEEPTVVMEFGVNSSPFSGQLKETLWVTSTQIKNRLEKETMTNLAMRVETGSTAESFRVKARGILQLGILIENLRREGFEVMIGPPEVITQTDPETGETLEPYEDVVVDTPSEFQGTVMEEMQKKSAEMVGMEPGAGESSMIMSFKIPTRNLIGMQGTLMRRTKGQAILNSRFAEYGPFQGDGLTFRDAGSVVSASDGKVTGYQLVKMKNRATFWVKPAEELYPGMVCGIHNKEEDITINMAKSKGVTNVREKTATGTEAPPPPIPMTIDDFLGHMDTDELLEVTPGPIRLLKKNSKALKVR
jgi:GTP-binding protein